ncbi:beta-defensin 12-like [Pteronotus mesoamericanus]|uniref:beta-defensin 12-like n=1 Tax=Pteronotus mesoamericanus TaxID=1884717 RepID=UPI0023EAFC71|nr:beta-defensin 12-like [Pteronotus parnellii mesoamericanus]
MCFVFNLGCLAGLDYSWPFPGGEFAACEACKLGRGKCRRTCLEDEKVVGSCKLNFFCCRRRIQ